MKEQTLKELWNNLDPDGQAKLIGLISSNLFTATTTAIVYVRGYRPVPQIKRPKLSALIEENFSVRLKYA